MADTPRPVAKVGSFAGIIVAAAAVHMDTRQLFGMIRQEADRLGVALPANIVPEVARIRSGATKMAYGSELLARSPIEATITGDMIGREPYGRTFYGPADVPSWMVSFELDVTRGTETTTEWHHLSYTGSLPATIGDLHQEIADYSDLLAASYSVAVGLFGTIRIGAT